MRPSSLTRPSFSDEASSFSDEGCYFSVEASFFIDEGVVDDAFISAMSLTWPSSH